ncbi:MAG: cell division protein FtsZ [Verrucomicrobiota bacterium]
MKNLPDTAETNSTMKTSIKVFGIGGAGCNAMNSIVGENVSGLTLIALNTDAQSLANCAAPEKFCLGAKLTHGLGAGGDPEVGRDAAEADLESLREFCGEAKIVFIVCGLGGGTGTGASSVVARVAKDSGALVLGIVTMPFEFEGSRRHRQAQLGLQQLKCVADAVICLPNQKVFKLINEKTTVLETFSLMNEALGQGVAGISRLLTQTGLINVDFADLCSVTRNLHAESSFATADASGENRALQIVEKLFAHPMLENGELLSDSDSILVSLAGGTDLTMAEVNRVMAEINHRCDEAHVIFGAVIDEAFVNQLSVTIVASGRKGHEEKIPVPVPNHRNTATSAEPQSASHLLDSNSTSRPASRILAPAPHFTQEKKEQLLTRQSGSRQKKNASRMRQNELPLEIISKGRFEKSEPTIHRGEDLDLPTYIRRGIALN